MVSIKLVSQNNIPDAANSSWIVWDVLKDEVPIHRISTEINPENQHPKNSLRAIAISLSKQLCLSSDKISYIDSFVRLEVLFFNCLVEMFPNHIQE